MEADKLGLDRKSLVWKDVLFHRDVKLQQWQNIDCMG